jgi:hypothetical protein
MIVVTEKPNDCVVDKGVQGGAGNVGASTAERTSNWYFPTSTH